MVQNSQGGKQEKCSESPVSWNGNETGWRSQTGSAHWSEAERLPVWYCSEFNKKKETLAWVLNWPVIKNNTNRVNIRGRRDSDHSRYVE